MTTIGVVGLGAMGGRVAGRLLSQGFAVHGTNRTRSRADALVTRGLIWCDSPWATAQSSGVVISMVTNDAALAAVTEGPDGILAGLVPGTVYIDMSTVSPKASRALAEQVASRGATMLSAPVSGSVPAAEAGQLAIIAGGPIEAFEHVEPVLRQLGSTVTQSDRATNSSVPIMASISIMASNARLASAPPAAIASVRTRGVI